MAPVEGAVPAPSDAQRDAALRRALAYAASKGVTAFAHVSVVPADLGTYLRARAAGALTARAALYFPLETWHAVADTIARIGRGDDWVWIGGVKGYMDGSLGSRTALFYEPYDDDPKTSGLLRTPEDSLRAWIGAADSAGLQVTVHAIGERANGLILDIYDSVARAHGSRDRRFRIEHAQHLRRRGHRPDRPLGRHRVDAALPRDRRRPVGREAHRAGPGEGDVRLPLAARPPGAPGLRLRLERGADRPDPRHLRGGDPADPRREASRRLAPGAEDQRRGSAPGLHQRRRLRRSSPSAGAAGSRRASRPTWCCWTRTSPGSRRRRSSGWPCARRWSAAVSYTRGSRARLRQ